MSAVANSRPLSRFVLAVGFWLPFCFTLWYLAAPVLVWPVALGARVSARLALSDFVVGVEQSGSVLTFLTTIKVAAARSGALLVDVNALLYLFGLPLFTALVLAARQGRLARVLAIGYAVMTLCAVLGVIADFLKSVAISSGPAIASQLSFSAWEREVIAFTYQLSTLILPTVVPAVAWVLLHRRFVENLIAQARLHALRSGAEKS